MKTLSLLLSLGLIFAISTSVEAAKPSKKARLAKMKAKANAKKKAAAAEEGLGTNHNFDDHGVFGEYQMPDEALAKVENEKGLNDLLGVRPHFKDRLAEASEQE